MRSGEVGGATTMHAMAIRAFGGLDVALEFLEAVVGRAHQPHPVDGGGPAGAPIPGMPSPTPVRGRRPAACASPARVRRWDCTAESAIR